MTVRLNNDCEKTITFLNSNLQGYRSPYSCLCPVPVPHGTVGAICVSLKSPADLFCISIVLFGKAIMENTLAQCCEFRSARKVGTTLVGLYNIITKYAIKIR